MEYKQLMKIVEIPLHEIKPYQKNAKKHPKEQIEKVAQSIDQFGMNQPIVIDSDYVIIVGHCRALALQALGKKTAPCLIADWLTEEQKIAWRIADNKVAESEWDFDFLKFEFGTLDAHGVDLTLTGFDHLEIEKLMTDSFLIEEPKEKDAPEDKEEELKTCPNCGCAIDG